MIFYIIDLGSNTIRLSSYKRDDNNFYKEDEKVVNAQIVSYIKDSIMTEEGTSKIIKTLDFLLNGKRDNVFVLATASIRNCTNGKDVINEVYKKTGINITILTGAEEAFYTLQGALYEIKEKNFTIFDIGGGSTEIIYSGEDDNSFFSLPIGSLNIDALICYEINKEKEIKDIISDKLIDIGMDFCKIKNYVSGGTAETSFKAFEFLIGKTDFLDIRKINTLILNIENNTKNIKGFISQTDPKRVETIVNGLHIIKSLMLILNVNKVYLVTLGIKEGYIKKHLIN
ncbi:MAG: hypothetical protein ACRCZK_02205 [Oscillospiraceae bacterium]